MKVRSRLFQRGQSLPLLVLFLPVLMGFCALGIDVARLYVERSAEQATADLAALSGARQLPSSASGAQSQATAIATANGYTTGSASTTVTVTTPYSTDSSKIEVRITRTLPLLFLQVLGVNSMDVSARGVARHQPASTPGPYYSTPYSIFAGASDCAAGANSYAIDWTASNLHITGVVHSEAGVKITGGNNVLNGAMTYRCAGLFVNTGTNNNYSPAPAYLAPTVAWPVTYTWSDLCGSGGTYYHASGKWDLAANGAWWVGGTRASLPLNPGVYCADSATAQIALTPGNVVANNVTLVSKGTIDISGANFAITANTNNLAMAAFGAGTNKQIYTSGTDAGWTGILYAPNGDIVVTGTSASTLHGSLVGLYVTLPGDNFTMMSPADSAGPPASPEVLQLTE